MDRILFRLVIPTLLIAISANTSTAFLVVQEEGELRKWTAANGKFSVSAKLISCDDDKVKLESKDGKIYNVEVGKLCDADQAFVKTFLSSEENPFAQNAAPTGRKSQPEMESDEDGDDDFFGTGFGRGANNNRTRNNRRNSKESSPSVRVPKAGKLKFGRPRLKLRSGEYDVDISPAEKLTFDSDTIDFIEPPVSDRYTFHDRMGDWAISINEKFVATVVSNPFDKKAWVSVINLSNGESTEPFELPWQETKLLSVSPDGKMILTTNHAPRIPSRTDLWEIEDDKLKHVRGWKTRGFHDHDGVKFESAVIINDTKVLSTGTETAVWDLESGSDDFSASSKSSIRKTLPVISPDRKSFALATAGRIHILNILTGEVEGILERADEASKNSDWQEMAFSPSGEYFAARKGTNLAIWNLNSGMMEDQFPVLETGGLAWINDRYFLLGGAIHDAQLKVVVWKYAVNSNNLVSLSDGRFLFADKGGLCVIDLPHVEFNERIAQLDESELPVLSEGDTVGLDFSGLKEIDAKSIDKIEDVWTEELFDLGVKVRSGDDFDRVLRFKVHVGKQEEHEVRDMMDPFPLGGPFGRSRRGEEVKFKKKSASIEVVVNGEVMWRRSSLFGPSPIIMHLRDGETAQQHVDRTSKVNANFFTSNFIPEGLRALPPELVGESKITRNGVE